MICRKSSRYSKGILICLIYVIFTLFPVFYLVFSGGKGDLKIWNLRRAGLMVNSLITALFTVMACLLVAVFSSLKIYTSFKKRPLLRWYFLLLAPVPSYIYALSYMNLIRFAGRFFPGVLRWRMAGIFPCVLVESFAYLPLALAAALTALERISEDEWNAALLFDSADMVFFKVVLPKQMPWLLAAGALIFTLSVTDYSIPSLFQVNVYAMEIFSDYSAAGQSINSLRLSLPLVLISTLIILISFYPLKSIPNAIKTGERVSPLYSGGLRTVCSVCVFLTALQIILPLLSFVPYIIMPGGEFVSALPQLYNSLAAGMAAVIIHILPSALMAYHLTKDDTLCKPALWICALFPLCIPGVLTGIGILGLVSSTPLYVLRTGVILPALGLAIRYMPFSMLIQYGCYLRLDRDRINAAGLLQNKCGKAFLKVQLPLMAPGLIVSSIAVLLLTLGDVGTSLVLMSAGREPMSVKIYNYLHYGSSEKVTYFCLLQTVVCLLLMITAYMVMDIAGKRRKN